MSLGETCLTTRKIIFDNYEYITSGRNRINIEYILQIPPYLYDMMVIKGIVFSASEWIKVKDYVSMARADGAFVNFKDCYVLEDEALSTPFFKEKGQAINYIREKPEEWPEWINDDSGITVLKGTFTAGQWDQVQVNENIKKIIELKKEQKESDQ